MSQPNLAGQLQTIKVINERIARDVETRDVMERELQKQVRAGKSTGDPITDILYQYGLPQRLEHLEHNLRAIDKKLRSCANEFVLLEVIAPDGDHQSTVGLLPASYTSNQQPLRSMHYLSPESITPGIQIEARSTEAIILLADIVRHLTFGLLPERRGLLGRSHSFRLVIGFEEMEKHLLRDYSQTLLETASQRATRMKILARTLSSLCRQFSLTCDPYPEMMRLMRESEQD